MPATAIEWLAKPACWRAVALLCEMLAIIIRSGPCPWPHKQVARPGHLAVFDLPNTVGQCYRAAAFSQLGISFASDQQICVSAGGLTIGN